MISLKSSSVSIVLFLSCVVLCHGQVRLNTSVVIPVHYQVDLMVNQFYNTFQTNTTIVFDLLEDTTQIRMHASRLTSPWLSARVYSEDGEEFRPFSSTISFGGSSENLMLEFREPIPRGENYTLIFARANGMLGWGLYLETLPDPNK